MTLPRLPRKLATIRDKYGLRFQIVGISNHVKLPVIVGLQPSDLKIYRTDVALYLKVGPPIDDIPIVDKP